VSRERYANPAAEVEEKISRWMGAEYHQEAAVVIGAQSDEEKESALAEQNQAPAQTGQPKTAEIVKEEPPIVPEPKKLSQQENFSSPQNSLLKEKPRSSRPGKAAPTKRSARAF